MRQRQRELSLSTIAVTAASVSSRVVGCASMSTRRDPLWIVRDGGCYILCGRDADLKKEMDRLRTPKSLFLDSKGAGPKLRNA